MADQSSGPYEDILGGIFSGAARPSGQRPAFSKPPEEKGVPWEAKVIDGKYYIPLSQVADLLRQNEVLPKVRAGIERRVEAGPSQS